jgi:hypothetical protein
VFPEELTEKVKQEKQMKPLMKLREVWNQWPQSKARTLQIRMEA